MILAGLVLAPLLAVALWKLSPLLALLVIFASHMTVLYPTLRPTSQWLGRVVTSFHTTEKEVWLTIDDGPDADSDEFLALLARHEALATFFVRGDRLTQHDVVARRIRAAGHELANHSATHPSASFWVLGPRRIAQEIDGCDALIRAIDRDRRPLFRAPVGMKNPFVHPLLAKRGMQLIAWSARGFDGVKSSSPREVAARIRRDVRPGAIVLLHQGRPSHSVEVLALVLDDLTEAGYRCVIPDASRFLPPLEHEQVIVEGSAPPQRTDVDRGHPG